jgi:hypothetical protein
VLVSPDKAQEVVGMLRQLADALEAQHEQAPSEPKPRRRPARRVGVAGDETAASPEDRKLAREALERAGIL